LSGNFAEMMTSTPFRDLLDDANHSYIYIDRQIDKKMDGRMDRLD